jgi:phosphate transport system ATP-binding protein
MELRKPPPVRRLSPDSTVTPVSSWETLATIERPATTNGHGTGNGHTNGHRSVNGNGNGHGHGHGTEQAAASTFVSAGRERRTLTATIDRMAVEDVSIAYSGKPAVKSVSLPIRQGEVLAMIGPSGCGKTTLLRSLNRLTELTKTASLDGRITLDGMDIASFEPTELRRRVTMVFQQPNPFPMSVFDNIAYVLREQAKRRPGKSALRPMVEDALARAGLLEEVKDNLDHPALRLSGGQQQRLCIARALAANPEVLLLDEPCSALDPQSTKVIEDLIVKLREEVAVVIVTHNLQQAHRVADWVAFMYLGELVEYSTASALFGNPREQRTKEYVSGAFG